MLLTLAETALVIGGCGESSKPPPQTTGPTAGDVAADQPADKDTDAGGAEKASPVAANLSEPNLILDGGQSTLDQKLAELRGHPVVVNQWASWCPPCRDELPFFNESAKAHAAAGDVAFLGLNYLDDRGAAESYLNEVPIVFPSVFDPDGELVRSLEGGNANPSTMLVDERGEVAFVHLGAYPDREALEAEIDQYLLSG